MMPAEFINGIVFIFIGFILGIAFIHWAQKALKNRGGHGKCAICEKEGYLFKCQQCNRKVAMCHDYHFLLPDTPDPKFLRARKSKDICSECLIPAARHVVDNI